MKFLSNVAFAIRATLLLFMVMGVDIFYRAAMWLATEEELRQLKEKQDV